MSIQCDACSSVAALVQCMAWCERTPLVGQCILANGGMLTDEGMLLGQNSS
jgi:hypothetical protein